MRLLKTLRDTAMFLFAMAGVYAAFAALSFIMEAPLP